MIKKIDFRYHDGKNNSGTVIAIKRSRLGRATQGPRTFIVRPVDPVMGETVVRDRLLVPEDMVTSDIS